MSDVWGRSERSLKVFISSPGGVEVERQAVSRIIEEINQGVGRKLGLFLRIVQWERQRPRGENVMYEIRRQLQDCDLFLMLFGRRFGSSPGPGSRWGSGTEEEFNIARELRAEHGRKRPEIFTYFREISDEAVLDDPGPDLMRVLKFKREHRDEMFYKEYASADVFPFKLKDDLVDWLFEIAADTGTTEAHAYKESVLRRLFSLGAPPGHQPEALIVYPPVDTQKGEMTHLLPFMVLEDFQAIHKITKCLNIAGCHEVRAKTTHVYDESADRHSNKIFVCLPRSKPAERCLGAITDARFCIRDTPQGDVSPRRIAWKASPSQLVSVRSPQSKYLELQREHRAEEWSSEPGKCFAVDFAVVARFPDPLAMGNMELGALSSLFVFGIRGLGTWGAGWYLDRRFDEIDERLKKGDSYQALLRVEYRNYRIREVRDVSAEPQEFFDAELHDETIQKNISEFASA